MRVFFVLTPPFNPNKGGVSRTTFKLGQYFTENGLAVGYYSFASKGHSEVHYGSLYYSNREGMAQNSENIKDLKRALENFQPDIVINQMPYEKDIRTLLANEKDRLKYILIGCLRNTLFSVKNNLDAYGQQVLPRPLMPFFKNPPGRWILLNLHYYKHRRELKCILDLHDRFVLLTPPNRAELRYFVRDYQQEKVHAIPNSIPKINNGYLANENEKQKIMLHVGRLNNTQKRSDLLVPFWKKVSQELPDWEFVVIGDGPYKKILEARIKREKVPRITLQGHQAPEPYYKIASLFIMPSAYEGFPNVLLEAQNHGVIPVVFDSYPALSWIVNDLQDALLSPPYDTERMAHQAVELARDDKRLKSMRANSKENVKRFTIDEVGQDWLAFFNELFRENAFT